MNYIELLNQFWSCHKENCFSTSEIALYFHLVHTANSLAWKNPFREGNLFICASLGISEPTFQRSRDRLVTAGLIKYKSGKVKREITEYELLTLGINNFTLSDTLSSTKSDTLNDTLSNTLSDEKPLDNIKQNKTKPIIIYNNDTIDLNEWSKKMFDLKFINEKSLDLFDKLLRIDKYSIEDIKNAITWARNDNFWCSNFLSPLKLRNKDRNGVKYIDVFLAKILKNNTKNGIGNQQGATWNEITSAIRENFG